MIESEYALTHVPIVPRKKRKQPEKPPNQHAKAAEQLLKKLGNPKNACRLITCEFDENFLQMSGLLTSLTSKLEANWQSSTLQYLHSANDPLEQGVSQQLPPLIQPKSVGLNGPNGSVPTSFSFTWTRYQPRLEVSPQENGSELNDNQSSPRIKLDPIVEPEVVILLTTDQIKNLLVKSTSNNNKQNVHKNTSLMDAFGTTLLNLQRPVTCIFLTGSNLKSKNSSSSSSSLSAFNSSSSMSINELCIELQLNWGVHSTRITSNLHDVAMILSAFTRSLADRQFKHGRLERDEGLAFHPDNVHKGLSGCALRGRGPGRPPINDPEGFIDQQQAVHSWANRVWLSQLGQWRGLTGEIAYAITLVYPTARAFYNACKSAEMCTIRSQGCDQSYPVTTTLSSSDKCLNQKSVHPFEAELANLEIRRGAGVLSSRRRLGPELARRLIKLFTSNNPYEVIN
ncbi:unnamed protein product [Heterobilharzia americana]|nr:unnamed protein product [Heterobilharzia americana]CAH8607933.1 unnamed protein product [Heterobilharzia americana]